jgi:(p)ppGpp synthase/HD superfamily hydrolase
MSPILRQARDFAIAAHGAQRYGDRPYAYHLDMVVALLEPYGEQAQVVGYLHDTVEDTATSLSGIEAAFDAHVAACVAILTDAPGEDRRARKRHTYEEMARVTGTLELALLVKTADRLANVRACIDDGLERKLHTYRTEHPAFRTAAFRAGLCDPLWAELDALLAAERIP